MNNKKHHTSTNPYSTTA